MSGEVPAGCAAHREAAHDDAIFVDGIILPHVVERLEQVHLAGEPVRVAVTAIEVKDKGVRWSEFAGGL